MNLINNNTGLLIRFDDVAPNMNWEFMNKCEKLFLKYEIKPVLGVIPNNEDDQLLSFPYEEKFWDKVKKWQSYNWEIAIHGHNHKYTSETQKKDYFNYGGKSEFFGYSFEDQLSKLQKSIEVFREKNINVRCFFAPNHTYDLNTFEALKAIGIKQILDGYGLFPYNKFGILFIPQLFYKTIILPFGIQSTQIHLNEWKLSDYENFENFIKKHHKKIISYDYAISKTDDSFKNKIFRLIIENFLKSFRSLNFKF
jgi:predicted deacetylase